MFRLRCLIACLILLLFALASVGPPTGTYGPRPAIALAVPCPQESVSLQSLQRDFAEQLSQLASKCEELKRTDLATATRDWLLPDDNSRQWLFLPAPAYSDPIKIADDDSTGQFWSQRLKTARQNYARALMELASQQLEATDTNDDTQVQQANGLAMQCLYLAAYQDPENALANQLLGRKQIDGKFPFQDLNRVTYRKARRPDKDLQWAAGQYFECQSPHFRAITTADRTQAEQVVTQLETWRLLWRQWAHPYWMAPGALRASLRLKREIPETGEKRHELVLFQDRQQFLTQLAHIKGIERSVGYYDGQLQRAFFYLDPDDPTLTATWIHELTHQLFSETGRRTQQPGEKANTWLAEGIAIYTETLHPFLPADASTSPESHPPTRWSLGGFDGRRLQYARIRWFREGYFLPFADLAGRGRLDFQSDPNLKQTYAQAGAMTQFLLHSEQPRYRSALWEMLTLLYAGRDRADSLTTLCNCEPQQLETEYKTWLAFQPRQAKFFPLAEQAMELALGYCELNSQQLSELHAPHLFLLQLSQTNVDNELEEWLGKQTQLQQLFLDKTAIGDSAVIAAVQSNPKLQDLDLAGTGVTDQSIQAMGGHANLQRLWLTSTSVTDQSVPALLEIPQLELLNVQNTQLSAAAIEQLRKKIAKVVN